MRATSLGLTIPDLPLRYVGGAKVTTTVVDGGTERPRSLERYDRTGRVLSRDEADKDGSSDDNNKRPHFYLDWWSGTRITRGASQTCVLGKEMHDA